MSFYNNSTSNCYLPEPPRLWSRVQNSCSVNTEDNPDSLVRVPYSNNLVPAAQFGYQLAMLNKGNILQYKANSANLTKAQRYSRIAKGQWVNRNTTWGVQNDRGYTNPNTLSLKRAGNVVNIAIDPITGANLGPTTLPVTCIKPINPINNVLPSSTPSSENTPPPPPPPPQPPGPNVIPITPVIPLDPIVIQDGGILICSVQENICTGEIVETVSQQLCNLTTDSDVPGRIQELCWNDGTPTWYPRQRYIMTNSTNKWPYSSGGSAPLQSAIRPMPPILETITEESGLIILTWKIIDMCLPVSSFLLYENDKLLGELAGSLNTITIPIVQSGTLSYYMFAKSGSILSNKSNILTIQIY